MVGLYPFAIGFGLSGKSCEAEYSIADDDYAPKAGRYVHYLQMWSIIACLVTFFPAVIMLKISIIASRGNFSNIYLLDFGVLAGLGAVIAARLVARAVSVRNSYRTQILKEKKNDKEKEYPPDPTRDFLGEHWWSFPTSLTGVFVLLWALLKFTGLDEILLNLFK